MNEYFADLHVHIGKGSNGKPVKITASSDLTFTNILKECMNRKGIDIVGIIDCMAPSVLDEIKYLLKTGDLIELQDGGLRYKDSITIISGAEIDIAAGKGEAHILCFFPGIEQITKFSKYMKKYIKNINLSSQKCYLTPLELLKLVMDYDGIYIPAHIFTPFKSLYGSCTDSLEGLYEEQYENIFAVELGLSSDTDMADMINELSDKTFLSNSDAHSLKKIAREFNVFHIEEPTFAEIVKALRRIEKRAVIANYGLDPRLGKYHRTFCLDCDTIMTGKPPQYQCENCGSLNTVHGVLDRLMVLRDQETIHPCHRPIYKYNIPLEFIPGIGNKTIDKLLDLFHSELYVLHKASIDELQKIVNKKTAENIIKARNGTASVNAGGGGLYGHITF